MNLSPQSCDSARAGTRSQELSLVDSTIDSFPKRYCVYRVLKYKCLTTTVPARLWREESSALCSEARETTTMTIIFTEKYLPTFIYGCLRAGAKFLCIVCRLLPLALDVCFLLANASGAIQHYFLRKTQTRNFFLRRSFFISLR